MRKLLILLFPSLILGCAGNNQKAISSSFNYMKGDDGLINLLVQNGSNPNKVHSIDFIIECKSEQVVSDIVSEATQLGFEEDYINYSDKNGYWSTTLTTEVKLNLVDVSAQRNKLMPFIPNTSCKKVSWGASVVK